MSIYDYEQAFGDWDKTGSAMRQAIGDWFSLYYNDRKDDKADPCQRIAYTVVTKLVKTIFGEYKVNCKDKNTLAAVRALDDIRKKAMQLTLVGGECYLKPYPEADGFVFSVIPRNNLLIFARDENGMPTDVGMVANSVHNDRYYTLLERRRMDADGILTIENKLFSSLNSRSLGTQVPLSEYPAYAGLKSRYRYTQPIGSVGLVQLRTPMVNCVDGSADGVSVYAAAAGLIRNIDSNEAQLNGEFSRGESRILASSDLLRPEEKTLEDHLFVGLDDDPEHVGLTVFSPNLRHQAFLERKQEYLRNVESIIGLRRGMLSDANVEDRTATEIASSSADYNLTVIDLQQVWEKALQQTLQLCATLAKVHGMPMLQTENVTVDWGNGVLYDEGKAWQAMVEMVDKGLLKPELALAWRFNMPAQTPEELALIRQQLMPAQ